MRRVAIPERQSMRLLRKLRRRRVLKRWPLSDALWDAALRAHSRLPTLDQESRQRLRELATVFAREKTFLPVREARLDEALQTRIAALACLPVLNLGLDWYRGWVSASKRHTSMSSVILSCSFAPCRAKNRLYSLYRGYRQARTWWLLARSSTFGAGCVGPFGPQRTSRPSA